MMKIINLTPHPLVLRRPDGGEIVIEPDPAGPARVSAVPGGPAGEVNGVPLYAATSFGEVTGLPAPKPDTVYVVSGMVGSQVRDRDDVLVPGTGPRDGAIRDEAGHIVAVTRLIKAC